MLRAGENSDTAEAFEGWFYARVQVGDRKFVPQFRVSVRNAEANIFPSSIVRNHFYNIILISSKHTGNVIKAVDTCKET